MPRWVAAKEYVPSLHLPVEPVGCEDEVVAGLGDELPKLVETPELVVAGCGIGEEIEPVAVEGAVLGAWFRM